MRRFWILDFGFWIGADKRSSRLRLSLRDWPCLAASDDGRVGRCNPKSKIQNPKSTTLAALILLGATTAAARADTITFTGTGIALRNCKIQSVQGGQVSYTDSNNQRQRRPLDQVEALGFDGLPELDQAEAALSQQDLNGGLWPLLRSALRAQGDVQRIWVHARLAQVHDLRGEYVQAAGHAAEVYALSDDVAWKSLRPVSPVNTPAFAAANEAVENLESAARRVKSSELQREIETMTRLVKGVHAKLAAEYKGQPIARGTTISGFAREVVAANDRQPDDAATAATAQPATTTSAPPATNNQPPPPTIPADDGSDPRSPGAIDRLLASNRAADAVKTCAEIEKNPGERDLSHFLYQYGKALALSGRKPDAAVMFTRCAILYPDAPDAGAALIETALIYRDEFRKPDVGRRLLEKVIADAQASGDDRSAATTLARELLGQWPAR